MPAGLVRPGSSPAASLTVDWQRRVLVSVMGWVPAPVYGVSVAEPQPGVGMNGIPIDHTHNNANPEVLVPSQHLAHEVGYDSRSPHRHSIQYLVTRVAVLAHSAAELGANDFRRPQAISNLAANFLC